MLVDAHLDFVRYAMHDFVRLFVRERPPTDADAAVRRALVGSQLYGGLWVFMIERMVHWVGEVGWVGAVVRGASGDRLSVVQGRSDAGACSLLARGGTIVVEVSVGDVPGRAVVCAGVLA